MALFRVLLHGKEFPGVIVGKPNTIGFYTTRFVEADNEKEAEMAALAVLRESPELEVPEEHRTSSAKVFVEEMVSVPPNTERVPSAGFTFYDTED